LSWANSLILKSLMTPDLPPSELFHPGSLKTRLTREGFHAFPALAEELDVPFEKSRRVILGKDEEDFRALDIMLEICRSMEIEPEPLDQEGIQALEPHISEEYTRGYTQVGDVAYVYPWEYGIALAENAEENGVRIMLLAEVLDITALDGGFVVKTSRGPIRTRFLVNAAGPYADRIADMAGVLDFGLNYAVSEMVITDKSSGQLVNHVTCAVTRPGMPRVVRPTVGGNLQILCSNYHPAKGPGDTETRREWTDENIEGARDLFPAISRRDIIRSYSGVRVFNTRVPDEHLYEVSRLNPNFFNLVTRLPGLAITPAMVDYMVQLMSEQGLDLVANPAFNPRRKKIPKVSELSDDEKDRLIAQEPRYGRIVCRCEEVSEGEIVDAIGRGARTIAGVKYRTRAGMGRCQRDFCGMHIAEILARELGIPVTDVTLKGPGSEIFR
jgi:glycerol-3-phosphate dehydrogenase